MSRSPLTFTTASGVHARFWPGDRGLPLLAVHGTLYSSAEMAEWLGPVLGSRPICAPDLPWHGASAAPEEEDAELLSVALLDVADALGWTRALGLGHSLGATALFGATLRRPALFSGHLVVGVPGDMDEELGAQYAQFAAGAEAGFPDDLVEVGWQRYYGRSFRTAHPEERARLAAMFRALDPKAAGRMLRATGRARPLLPRLGGWQTPVKALVMEEDEAVQVDAWARPLLDEMDAEVVRLPGGHCPFLEQPGAFLDELTAFLDQHDA